VDTGSLFKFEHYPEKGPSSQGKRTWRGFLFRAHEKGPEGACIPGKDLIDGGKESGSVVRSW
jgi:hypothetical protein